MGRASQEARGLKLRELNVSDLSFGRASQEARGLKFWLSGRHDLCKRRASQEARGLKSERFRRAFSDFVSRLARGAWIEITLLIKITSQSDVAPRKRRVD